MHMFSDVLALFVKYDSHLLFNWGKKFNKARYTYGYLRIEIIAAFKIGL